MRNITLTLALLLSSVGAVQGQDAPRSPVEVSRAFEQRFNAGDLDGLMRLYGEGSSFVAAPGANLQGSEKIKGALTQFLAAKLSMKLNVRQVYDSKSAALIVFDWTMAGIAPDGKNVQMAGTGADVVVPQSDGTWRYAIDNPFGVMLPKR